MSSVEPFVSSSMNPAPGGSEPSTDAICDLPERRAATVTVPAAGATLSRARAMAAASEAVKLRMDASRARVPPTPPPLVGPVTKAVPSIKEAPGPPPRLTGRR